MHQSVLALLWRGTCYGFHRLRQSTAEPGTVEWAVSRDGDSVGLMPCRDDLSLKEFATHCVRWIGELTDTMAGLSSPTTSSDVR